MKVDKVADMKVDKVADMVANMVAYMSCFNLVRGLVAGVGPNFFSTRRLCTRLASLFQTNGGPNPFILADLTIFGNKGA